MSRAIGEKRGFAHDISDDEVATHQVTRGAGDEEASTGKGVGARGSGWEVTRTWEAVVEGADGTISSAVDGLREADKRKRLLKDTTPLQRGIIRHLLLVLDLSVAMTEKDLRPNRYLLSLNLSISFVREFFEQNPISQLGIIGMRDGLAVRISDISGNPNDHITKLQVLKAEAPKGLPSLQNALEMARGALYHAPSHTTREVLVVMGSLLSSDPGDVHTTLNALVKAHITVGIIGLAAQVAICHTIVARTNPAMNPQQAYSVALHEQHFRELLMRRVTPPATSRAQVTAKKSANGNGTINGDAEGEMDADDLSRSSLLMMGFPSRIVDQAPTMCACHSKPTRGGYLCSRCRSKVCSLPTDCPACGLTLILSTHLARSYHHLFPLRNWHEVSWTRAAQKSQQRVCFGCQTPFPPIPQILDRTDHDATAIRNPQTSHSNPRRMALSTTRGSLDQTTADTTTGTKISHKSDSTTLQHSGVSESGRYECETCTSFFCIECDVFAHEVVHNCPGCQSQEGAIRRRMAMAEAEVEASSAG